MLRTIKLGSRRGNPRRLVTVAATFTAIGLVASCGSSDSGSGGDKLFYEGKTIEVIVPWAAGGGTDLGARFMAEPLHDAIPGKPSVQVVNKEGAAGIQGSNAWATNSRDDGTQVLYTSGSNNFYYLYHDKRIRYDYADMIPAVGVPTGRPIVVSKKIAQMDLKTLADQKKPIVFSALDALGMDSLDLIAWHILGIDVKVVFGYEGSGQMQTAFEQGEVDSLALTTASYQKGSIADMLKSGEAVGFLSNGQVKDGKIVRDPAFPDVPTLPELYEKIYGKAPSGPAFEAYKALLPAATTAQKVFWFHKDDPEAAVKAFEAAGKQLSTDEEFYKAGADIVGPYRVLYGDELKDIVSDITSITDESRNWALDFLVKNYDAPDPRK